MKRKLPLGVQTFRKIREENRYYVDKTGYAARLVEEGDHYFLSRPRRFGKSLFVDTLKELFEGNEPLFRGLAVHDRWDWSVRHPVVRLDFGSGDFKEPGYLHEDAAAQLAAIERRAGVAAEDASAPVRFRRLLAELHRRTGQRVVVLVDEYDRPILDALEAPRIARANRDYLRGLYSVTKTGDAHIRFSFLTGVSRFSKVSLFSGLNNPIDLRRHARTRTRGCRICFAPTTSRPSGRGWRSCSTPSPTSGIRGTRSRATKATTQACSTPGWQPRGWT